VNTGAVAAAVAMPLADVVALGTVLACATMSTGFPRPAAYAALAFVTLVFAALSVSGLHRLRICLRVADQAGRIIAAAALPVVALLPWLTAGQAFRLAAAAAALLIVARVAVSAVLRAAHRRGRLTERVLLAGGGPEAGELARLLAEHPELGLRPVDGLGSCTGVSRVIVCAPGGSGSDQGSMLRAARRSSARSASSARGSSPRSSSCARWAGTATRTRPGRCLPGSAAPSAGSCGSRTSMSCRSWSACCAGTCPWSGRGRNARTSSGSSARPCPATPGGSGCPPA
jgi:hypothetical protein